MKKTVILALFCIMTVCSYAQKEKGFVVKGTIKGAGDCVLLISNVTINNDWIQDTVKVKNGKFTYTGSVNEPTYLGCLIPGSDVLGEKYYTFPIFLDNSKVTIKGDIQSNKSIVVKGSPSNDEYLAVNNLIKDEDTKFREARFASSTAFKAGDKVASVAANKMMNEALRAIKDKLLSVPNYSTSLVIPKIVNNYFSASSTFEQMGELTAKFDPSIHNHPIVHYLINDYKREKRVQDGLQAFNFELKDLEGNVHRLSDYKGKYVLLEFSASWCGWCKLEVPFLKEVYEITKGKDNFVMFTVNLDTKYELWKEEANVPWKTLSDLQGTKGGVAKEYNIHGIPMIYLLSPEGKILSRTLRREEMVQYFKDLYQ